MKKQLGNKTERTAKTLQLYANFSSYTYSSGCAGCGSVPSWDYLNVRGY